MIESDYKLVASTIAKAKKNTAGNIRKIWLVVELIDKFSNDNSKFDAAAFYTDCYKERSEDSKNG